MSRQFLEYLQAEIDATFIDNTEGAITPATTRAVLHDMVDSLQHAYCGMFADHTVTAQAVALTPTWSKITGFTGYEQSDPDELHVVLDDDEIETHYAGFYHTIQALLNFEGAVNTEYQFSVAVAGVPIGLISSVDGGGVGRIISAGDFGWFRAATIGQRMSIMARAPGGNSTIQLRQAELIGELIPTRSPS